MNGIVIEVLIGTLINGLARRSSQDASLVPRAVTAWRAHTLSLQDHGKAAIWL